MDGHKEHLRVKMTSINKGLLVGPEEGRIGVQVERVDSEVVLNCEGNNKECAGDMLC